MTTSLTKAPVMSESHFKKLRDIIYDRSGIHFQDNKKYLLESRLGRRIMELEMDDYNQYITFITIGPYRDDEFQEMFNRITINETSFFRNEPQLQVFEDLALSDMIESRSSSKRLRIWSAACSSGEEPFTLAMLIHQSLGIRLADWRLEILGTDISERALNIASEGIYSSYSIRTSPKIMVDRYFKEQGSHYVLDPEIHSMASFEQLNLKDKLGAKRHGKWDVIFCRNVLIYFDDEMKKSVLQMFCNQLQPDGWLFLGHSESIRGLDVPLEQVNAPQGFCYRKIGVNGSGANGKISLTK
jgi:chemotaxis protein methyltransferase CheR